MTLNPECLKDILLVIENNTGIDDDLSEIKINFDELCNKLSNYSKGEIAFTLLRLNEGNLINAMIYKGDNLPIYQAIIFGLSNSGESLLLSIKNEKKWKKITKAIKDKAPSTITALIEIIKLFT